MTVYEDLMAFQRQTEALAQVAGRLGWDQETVMPEGAAQQREVAYGHGWRWCQSASADWRSG